jgi:hypothetical protein
VKAKLSAARFALLIQALIVVVIGCYPSRHAHDIPPMPENVVPDDFGEAAEVLVLPLWLKTTNEGFRHSFFLAPPLVVSGREFHQIPDRITRYKGTTINMIPHPKHISSYTLQGLVAIYPDAKILWLDYFTTGPAWEQNKRAVLCDDWKAMLLDTFTTGEPVIYGEVGSQSGSLWQLSQGYIERHAPWCEGHKDIGFDDLLSESQARSAADACFNASIELQMSTEERLSVVEFVEPISVPSCNEGIVGWATIP